MAEGCDGDSDLSIDRGRLQSHIQPDRRAQRERDTSVLVGRQSALRDSHFPGAGR